MSLARRHRTMMLAVAATALAGAAETTRPGPEATEYELQRARLGDDLRRLREIQSIETKIELKRQLLPGYAAWVDGVLSAEVEDGKAEQDDIVVQIMIWRIDVGDFEGALPLVAYVLRHGLALPQRFTSTAPTMIAENVAESALKLLGQGEAFDFEILQRIDAITAEEDMHDQVRAKLKKALGLELARRAATIEEGADGPAGGKRAAFGAALEFLRRALDLNERVGVKTDIARIEKEIAKLAPPASE